LDVLATVGRAQWTAPEKSTFGFGTVDPLPVVILVLFCAGDAVDVVAIRVARARVEWLQAGIAVSLVHCAWQALVVVANAIGADLGDVLASFALLAVAALGLLV
jgi:hypothetical protein